MKNLRLASITLLFLFSCSVNCQNKDYKEAFIAAVTTQDADGVIENFNNIKDTSWLSSDKLYYLALAYLKKEDINNGLMALKKASQLGLSDKGFLGDDSLKVLSDLEGFSEIKRTILNNASMAKNELLEIRRNITYKFSSNAKEAFIDLSPKMTPVKHQGQRNTCSAFAATALAEYVVKKDAKKSLDLSESYNYYIGKKKGLYNQFLKEAYKNVDGLCGYLALEAYEHNMMEESQWPYENTNWLSSNDKRCVKANGIPEIECFTGVPPDSAKVGPMSLKTVFIPIDQIDKFILNEKRPVVVNIWIFQNGMNSQTGELTIPPVGQEIRAGGHVVVITGYNDQTKEYTFKNSWSEHWGNKGYGKMSKAYLEKHYEASVSLPFNLDASKEEKEYFTKASMGASAFVKL